MREVRTVPICDACWKKYREEREPVRLKEDLRKTEWCTWCGEPTESGIYVRGYR